MEPLVLQTISIIFHHLTSDFYVSNVLYFRIFYRRLKEERRIEQERNIRFKEKMKEEHKVKSLEGMKKKKKMEDGDDDDE